MSRRTVLVLVASTLLLAAGIVPWTVAPARLTGSVGRQLEEGYGLGITGLGRTSIAFLPMPRVKFERITVSGEGGAPLVRDTVLRGTLRVLPLLAGRVELGDVSLSGGTVAVAIDAAGRVNWALPLARLTARGGSREPLRRLVLAGCDLSVTDARSGSAASLAKLNLVANWPSPDSDLDLAGSASWRGETLEGTVSVARPLSLLRGGRESVDGRIGGRLITLVAAGALQFGEVGNFSGVTAMSTPALGPLLNWLGLDVGGGFDRAVALSGRAEASRDGISWSKAELDLAGNRLDGALSIDRRGGLAVQATLAAGTLDAGWLVPAFRSGLNEWSDEVRSGDVIRDLRLDLRLSASDMRIGGLVIGDSAMSILADEGRIDASLLRATLEGGTLKGRVSAQAETGRAELKAQMAFERVNVASLLAKLGRASAVSGLARGGASLEGTAATRADLLGTLGGRASLTLLNGEVSRLNTIVGSVPQPESRSGPEWPGGRASFDEAQVSVQVANGIAQITEARAEGPTIRASVRGEFSIPDGAVALRAVVGHPAPPTRTGWVLDVTGPWTAPTLVARDEARAPADGPPPPVLPR